MGADGRVVMLGGGFSEDEDTLLDDYVLGLTGRPRPRVCFVPTASGDAAGYVERFHAAFGDGRACEPSHLPLFRRTHDPAGLRAHLLAQDVVYVGGGNTANMLALWRLHGLDTVLREAYEAGVLLCGISAGAICWAESSLSDSYGPLAPLRDGLGLVPGSACPHYDSEPERAPAYARAVSSGALPGGWAVDDGAAAVFTGGVLSEAVSRAPGAAVWRVERRGGGEVVRSAASMRLLG